MKQSIADGITNIRYAPLGADDTHGQIAFDYLGERVIIREPTDVILVGTDPRLAADWIAANYGFLLAFGQTEVSK